MMLSEWKCSLFVFNGIGFLISVVVSGWFYFF